MTEPQPTELSEVLAALLDIRERVTYIETRVREYEAAANDLFDEVVPKLRQQLTPILGMFGIDPKSFGL